MIEHQTLTLICDNCRKITNRIKVYEYYTQEFKRIWESSSNYCIECHLQNKESRQRIIKESGEIKGFKLNRY